LYNFEDKPIDQVREILSQTIALYNTARPHRALNKKTPMQMLIPDYPNPLTTQPSKNQISKNNSPKAPSLKTPSPCRLTPNKDLSLCASSVKTTTGRVPQQEQN
ncbi:integrase core domain-containing protein, partial [Porphyromonas sp.]|uniref:integrase core domain-containing protein n=1 Tax=Porphyromonas sp. TaxID=1924944 RepID=UPI003AB3C2CB